MSETHLIAAVLLALGRRPDLCRVWRQNSGMLLDSHGRPVRFGVNGAGDISGILRDGRRLEVECKTEKGRQRPEQQSFEQMIRRFNGVYLLVRSADEALNGVEGALRGA
jgi:hypothetical protein